MYRRDLDLNKLRGFQEKYGDNTRFPYTQHDRTIFNFAEIVKESILKNDLETCFFYLKRLPPDTEDKNGESLLHIAALNAQTEVIRYMIFLGWDIKATDKLGQNVLHKAANMGYVEVLNLLSINLIDSLNKKCSNRGFTPLHCAAYNGFPQSISVLLYHGAALEPLDRLISTPAHVACQAGHLGSLKRLLEFGSNPNHKNIFGDTLLHAAVRYGHQDIVSNLLDNCNVDINKKNRNGDTPLHVAISLKREIIASLLLNHGIRVDVRNMQDLLPIDLISDRKEFAKLVLLLKKAKKKKTKQIYDEIKTQKFSLFKIFRRVKRPTTTSKDDLVGMRPSPKGDENDDQGLAPIKSEAPIYPINLNIEQVANNKKVTGGNIPPLVRSRSDESLNSGNNKQLRKDKAWNIQANKNCLPPSHQYRRETPMTTNILKQNNNTNNHFNSLVPTYFNQNQLLKKRLAGIEACQNSADLRNNILFASIPNIAANVHQDGSLNDDENHNISADTSHSSTSDSFLIS